MFIVVVDGAVARNRLVHGLAVLVISGSAFHDMLLLL